VRPKGQNRNYAEWGKIILTSVEREVFTQMDPTKPVVDQYIGGLDQDQGRREQV